MKLELLTHSTVVDDAMRFVSQHQSNNKKVKNSNIESEESDYAEELGEEQEKETDVETTNGVF